MSHHPPSLAPFYHRPWWATIRSERDGNPLRDAAQTRRIPARNYSGPRSRPSGRAISQGGGAYGGAGRGGSCPGRASSDFMASSRSGVDLSVRCGAARLRQGYGVPLAWTETRAEGSCPVKECPHVTSRLGRYCSSTMSRTPAFVLTAVLLVVSASALQAQSLAEAAGKRKPLDAKR